MKALARCSVSVSCVLSLTFICVSLFSFRKWLKPLPASGEECRFARGAFPNVFFFVIKQIVNIVMCVNIILPAGSHLQRDTHQPTKMPAHSDQDYLPSQPGSLEFFYFLICDPLPHIPGLLFVLGWTFWDHRSHRGVLRHDQALPVQWRKLK